MSLSGAGAATVAALLLTVAAVAVAGSAANARVERFYEGRVQEIFDDGAEALGGGVPLRPVEGGYVEGFLSVRQPTQPRPGPPPPSRPPADFSQRRKSLSVLCRTGNNQACLSLLQLAKPGLTFSEGKMVLDACFASANDRVCRAAAAKGVPPSKLLAAANEIQGLHDSRPKSPDAVAGRLAASGQRAPVATIPAPRKFGTSKILR